MKRRFVIATEKFDAEKNAKLREYLNRHGHWWHWIGGFWLFTSRDEDISCANIRDHIKTIDSESRVLVMETPEDKDWATLGGPNAKGQQMTAWLNGTWKGD
jgi:hypothetical protein